MFPDETTITNSHTSTAPFHREINHDLNNNSQNWPLANQLSLNAPKTEYMYFAADYNLSNLGILARDPSKINQQPITRAQSTKSLRVVFDQRLVYEEHVDSLCKSVSGLATLRQARQDVPQDTLLTVYNAVIKPFFDYCDVLWGNLIETLTARLQKLQNRAARIITRKGYDVKSADIRRELRWNDLETIRKKTLGNRHV